MNMNFPRILSLLRKEKGISQKKVAAELGCSQALLSHYENGVREPGLAFVVKAADYYSVSADFLLGRTMARDGTGLHIDEVPDISEERGNVLKGSAAALLSKKLLVNTIGLLFDFADRSGNRKLASLMYSYISAAIYKIFRRIYAVSGKLPDTFFPVPEERAHAGADAHMRLTDLCISEHLQSCNPPLPPVSNEALERDYPLLLPSLLSLVHGAGKEISKIYHEE